MGDAARRGEQLALTDDALRRVDALIGVGLRLARSARTGRVLLARIADAIEPEWIPRPWGESIVAALQSAAATARGPVDPRTVDRILSRAWGAPPAEELDRLEPEPVAVTPGAQVHRASLDGAPVAVKILRPGLASAVRQDLTLLEGLLAPLGAAFPGLDARAVLHEFRERVVDELDLEHEATVLRRVHLALRLHPFLAAPAPVTRLCRPEVLVSEWIDGVRLRDAPDPDQAAARFALFVFGAAAAGVVHADPDPDDVLVLRDGRVAILDFGATATPDPVRIRGTAAALEAFATADADAFEEAIHGLGLLPRELAPAAFDLARHALGRLSGPGTARLDSAAVVAARDRLIGRREVLAQVISAGRLAPEDLYPARSFAQVFGAIAKVGATGNWLELAVRGLREGLDADR